MPLFYPTAMFDKISEIKPELLKRYGVSALILDVDNTLATHDSQIPDKDVLLWLDLMKKTGIKLVIASNNYRKRVEPFARSLGLDYSASSFKPLPVGFLRVSKRLGMTAESFGVVGDQVFTDVLGGNLFGAKTFLVKPLSDRELSSIKLKRKIEALILRDYPKNDAGKENLP